MAFNLNTSNKPEVQLNRNLIKELIEMYGLKVKFLFVQKMNKNEVFLDYSHFEINPEIETKDIYLLPENPEDWEGDSVFNSFGLYNQWTQHLFIAKDTVEELFPDENGVLDNCRAQMLNNLIITPSSTILEITNMETYTPGINNLWGYNDDISGYRLSVKIYDVNIADKGISNIKETITLEEQGDDIPNSGDEIFEKDVITDTSSIDAFLEKFANDVDVIETLSEQGDDKGNKPSNTNSPFGNLS